MKKEKKFKVILILIVILIVVFFLIIKPYIKFKSIEKEVLKSGKRYYEINTTLLPTGEKIRTLRLKELYTKDYLDKDLKKLIDKKGYSLDNSFVKVKKEEGNYAYYTYLECGIFKSNVDHEGPIINLKGKDEITLYKGEEYKELGVSSVVDDTDGKLKIKDVEIDSSNLNINKVGTYEITYKIKDSFDNETEKVRVVKVVETLNHIVEKDTDKEKIYKGAQYNNYVRIDGILFKIVKINSDSSVMLVTNNVISAVSYDKVEEWLNDYFYEKLSDSAKEYIKKDSKWCIDTVKDSTKYNKCSKYSKKNPVGLLSILDYENSKGDDGIYNVALTSLTYNLKSKDIAYYYRAGSYKEVSINDNLVISPVINIVKDSPIKSGDGSIDNPYILKGTNEKLKAGDKISDAKTGEYLTYSGYKFRVISKDSDDTTEVIMDDVININSDNKYVHFDNNKIVFDVSKEGNIGYLLKNNVSNYIKTKLFVSKNVDYKKYTNDIGYKNKSTSNEIKLKFNLPSMYDLYSTSLDNDYWFRDYSNDKYCYRLYTGTVSCESYDYNHIKGIRVVAYLDKSVTIKSGTGTLSDPYVIAS